eukprot:g6028.t1
MERSASYAGGEQNVAGVGDHSPPHADHRLLRESVVRESRPLMKPAAPASSKRSSGVGVGGPGGGNSRRQSIAETQQMLRNIIPNGGGPGGGMLPGGMIGGSMGMGSNLLASPTASKKTAQQVSVPSPSMSMTGSVSNMKELRDSAVKQAAAKIMSGGGGGGGVSTSAQMSQQQHIPGQVVDHGKQRQLSHGNLPGAPGAGGATSSKGGGGKDEGRARAASQAQMNSSRSAGAFPAPRASEPAPKIAVAQTLLESGGLQAGPEDGKAAGSSYKSDDTGDVFNINIVAPARNRDSSQSSSGMLRSSSSSEDEEEADRKFRIEDEKRRSITGTSKRESMNLNTQQAKGLEGELKKKLVTQTLKIQELEATSRRDSFRADIRKMQIAKLEDELRKQKLGENPYSTSSSSDDDDDDEEDQENNQSGFTIVRTNTDGHDKSEVISRLDPSKMASKGKDASRRASASTTSGKKNKQGQQPSIPAPATSDARVKKLEREIALVRKQGVEKDHEVIRLRSEVEVLKAKTKNAQQTRVQVEKMRNEMTEAQKKADDRETRLKQQVSHLQAQVLKFKKLQAIVDYIRGELLKESGGESTAGEGFAGRGSLTLACQTLVDGDHAEDESAIARDVRICDYLRQELLSGELAQRRSISAMPSQCNSRIMSRQGSLSKLKAGGGGAVTPAAKKTSQWASRANSNDTIEQKKATRDNPPAGSSGKKGGGTAGGPTTTSAAIGTPGTTGTSRGMGSPQSSHSPVNKEVAEAISMASVQNISANALAKMQSPKNAPSGEGMLGGAPK